MQFLLLFFLLTWSHAAPASPVLDKLHNYLVYYGTWNETKIQQALNFEMIILSPGLDDKNIDEKLITRLKKGKDGVLGTKDDILVLAYISIGEDSHIERGARELKAGYRGPVYQDNSGKMVVSNNGFREWYVDEVKYVIGKDKNKIWGEDGLPKTKAGHDGIPDENGKWHSYPVDVSNSEWQDDLHKKMKLYVDTYKCDGLFLDTVDTASPWGSYGYQQPAMVDLIVKIRSWFPKTVIVMNRGLFLFEKYGALLNKNVDGVMFESYVSEWDWYNNIGVPHRWFLSNELILRKHIKPLSMQKDGINVLFLNYFNQFQPEAPFFNYSLSQTNDIKGIHYVSDPTLVKISPKYEIVQQPTLPMQSLPPLIDFKIDMKEWHTGDPQRHVWFSLRKSTDPYSQYPFMWLVPPGNELNLSDVPSGSYKLDVRVVNTQGKLLKSGQADIVIPTQDRPQKVQNLQVQVHDKGLQLSWDAVAGADKYLIKWGSDRFAMRDEVFARGATSKFFPDLKNDKVYYFSVAAASGRKIGYPSDLSFAAPTKTTPPLAPTLTSAEFVNGCIELQWQANKEVSGFLVYVDPIELSQGLPIAVAASETKYCAKVLKPGTYVVRLSAHDERNNESPTTKSVMVKVK